MTPLVIIGSGGHAKAVIEATHNGQFSVIGLLDDREEIGSSKLGYDILGSIDEANKVGAALFIAVGDIYDRMSIMGRIGLPVDHYKTIIHPSATVATSEIGRGVFIGPGANIGPDCKVGNFAIVNTHASLDHDSSIGDFSHMAPGSITGGHVSIGHATMIGMHATIRDGVTVGNDCIIGMGSIITKDVRNNTRGWGIPLRAQ